MSLGQPANVIYITGRALGAINCLLWWAELGRGGDEHKLLSPSLIIWLLARRCTLSALCCSRTNQLDAHFCLLDDAQAICYRRGGGGGGGGRGRRGGEDEIRSEEVETTEALVVLCAVQCSLNKRDNLLEQRLVPCTIGGTLVVFLFINN